MAVLRSASVLPATRAELDAVAARVLLAAATVAGALLALSALANEAFGAPTLFSRLRGLYGLVLLGAAAFGHHQHRRSRPRRACIAVLLAVQAAAWGHALATGIGLH